MNEAIFETIPEEDLAVFQLSGRYDFNALLDKILWLFGQEVHFGNKKCLVDLRKAEFDFDHALLHQLQATLQNSFPDMNFLKLVFITNNPKTTIFALLFIQHLEKLNGNALQCSTLDYAIQVLGARSAEKTIKAVLEDLQFST